MERERELMEVRTRLEGENGDLHRDLEEKNKVQYVYHVHSHTHHQMYMYSTCTI